MSETRDVMLAIDIGDAKLAAGLMTMKGELLDRDEVDIDFAMNAEALFASLNVIAQAQLDRARTHHNARPVAVGVGCAGPVRPDVVAVSPTNIHAWRSFPLRSKLATATRLNVYGDLGAKALALAEGWLGAAQGRENFLAMVVSTSVEGGIVLNGQLLDGATGNAGHIGHVVVEPNGRRCLCGSRGCLEAEASGPAIEAITGRAPTEPTYEIMQRTGRLVGRGGGLGVQPARHRPGGRRWLGRAGIRGDVLQLRPGEPRRARPAVVQPGRPHHPSPSRRPWPAYRRRRGRAPWRAPGRSPS